MKSQDIFNQIKEQAESQEQNTFDSKEAVWDKVESQLPEENKRRIIPWIPMSIAASVLILLGVGGFYLLNNEDGKINSKQTIVTNNHMETKQEKSDVEIDEVNSKTENTLDESLAKNSLQINHNKKSEVLTELEKTTIAFQEPKEIISIKQPKVQIDLDGGNDEFELERITESGVEEKTSIEFGNVNMPLTKERIEKTTAMFGVKGNNQGRVVVDKNAKPLINNVSQMLQGRVAGVNISNSYGSPGSSLNVKIRGASSLNSGNEPLYVVDGVPINANKLGYLNPNSIKNVTLLKDASATSIYGNRGSNGVVILTTKNKLSRKERRKLRKERKRKTKKSNIQIADTNGFILPKIEVSNESYEHFVENQFESPSVEPLSTFSIDVDNASYSNVRRFINNGQTVPKDAVRIEEMINYFDYAYEQPKGEDPLAIHTEYSTAPWNPKHKLLKVGLQAQKIKTENLPASNLVFLVDVSGSMNDMNKLPLLKSSIKLLLEELRPEDKVSIVVYAGAAGLVLEPTSGNEKQKIINALDNLSAGGSTAGGAGIELAYKTAQENFVAGGNNRIILATDGDFNVGASSNKDMETLIEEKRKSGVFLTVLGYGMGNYKDDKMEILADKGNGNYAYIDNMQEANKFLVREFGGTIFTLAKDVKIQVEFNPEHVSAYRLIGYENRKLRPEDFKNDAIDAGEMGSGHSVTALYEIIPKGIESDYFVSPNELKYSKALNVETNFNNELGTIKFRYKKPNEDKSKELVQVVPLESKSIENTTSDFRFAASVAWFGLKLRDSKLIPNKASQEIENLAKSAKGKDEEGFRAEFIRLVNMVK